MEIAAAVPSDQGENLISGDFVQWRKENRLLFSLLA
jgi:hypothetical protein